MQTLRKRNSPCKFKNEPTRFLGEGVSFKAKLIGILEVSEARGDRMCQAALADLKMAIRAAGEHKQRITVQISIDGLRLRDEKTGECLFHHPVHKISFIAQDMSDSRAFGYIFGSPDTGHRFFGIKTDKAAIQVVMAMRDLFQVVFELKKKEIELEKQHNEQTTIKFYSSGMYMEPAPDTKGAASSEAASLHRAYSEVEKPVGRKHESQSGKVADLLDLQIELNSLQQGIHQLDKMAPEARRPSSEDPFEADPFGDSFTNIKVKETVQPILPPPPSSSKRGHLERQQTVTASQRTSGSSSPPSTQTASKTPPPQGSAHWFDKETEDLFNEGELSSLTRNTTTDKEKETNMNESTTPRSDYKSQQIDVFTELDPLGTGLIKPYVDKKDFFQHLKNPPKKVLKDLAVTSTTGDTFPTNFNITTEPMQPVKVQNTNTISTASQKFEETGFANFDKFETKDAPKSISPQQTGKEQGSKTIHHQPLSVSLPPEDTTSSHRCTQNNYASINTVMTNTAEIKKDEEIESMKDLVKLPSPKRHLRKNDFSGEVSVFRKQSNSSEKSFSIDFSTLSNDYSLGSPSLRNTAATTVTCCSVETGDHLRDLSSSSMEMDNVPEPPPRGAGSIIINPPPLPPKKQCSRGSIKPPPRPPYSDGHFHYDFLERDENSPSPTRRDRHRGSVKEARSHFDDNFSPPLPQLPKRLESSEVTNANFEDSFSSMIPSSLSSFFQNSITTEKTSETKRSKPSLDITLSQLTSSNLSELAASLNMTVSQLTSLTLQQLTECLSSLTRKDSIMEERNETTTSKAQEYHNNSDKSHMRTTMVKTTCTTSVSTTTTTTKTYDTFNISTSEAVSKSSDNTSYDKYAVFRELVEMEQKYEETEDHAEVDIEAEADADADAEDVEDEEENNEEDEEEFEKFEEEDDDEDAEEEELEEPNKRHLQDKFSENNQEREDKEEPLVSLKNLTVKLPADLATVTKSDTTHGNGAESSDSKKVDDEDETGTKSNEMTQPTKSKSEELTFKEKSAESSSEITNKGMEDNNEVSETKRKSQMNDKFEVAESFTEKKSEIKFSTSTSRDRYAALREIIDETEQASTKCEAELVSFPVSPSKNTEKSTTEIDLMNLFSDTFSPAVPASTESKKLLPKKEEGSRSNVMDIFEEIKMLNSSTDSTQRESSGASISKFEDVFCPFPGTKQDNNDNENWTKFDSNIFCSDKSSGDGHGSIGGTSPWSPDGRDFHREPPRMKPSSNAHRQSGDSDNEWKDDEESEESNGRLRSEGSRCGSGRHSRFESCFEDRSFYNEPMEHGDRGDRGRFKEKMGRKTRGGPWGKGNSHRAREPSSWHDDSRWEDERKRMHYFDMHRKIVYKDEEEHQVGIPHWKFRGKHRMWKNGSGVGGGGVVGGGSGGTGSSNECEKCWMHEPPEMCSRPFYEEERMKRRIMPWNDEEINRGDVGSRIDRFSSQESMGYEDDERWTRREYERKGKYEDDGTYWNRRGVMMESEYSSHACRNYCHDARDRSSQPPHLPLEHDYHSSMGWEEEEEDYSPDHPEDSPRYIARKRHWPKRPNSANDGRSREMGCYSDMRSKYGMSRSECSDNDSDPYHRSYRSRSRDRERYWNSDHEFDNWGESSLPPSHWSDVPAPPPLPHPPNVLSDAKSDTLHRRRINRHRTRTQIKHRQQSSPFEDDFTQSMDRRSEASLDSITSEQQRGPRMVDLDIKQQQQQQMPSLSPRNTKDAKRDPKSHKSSSYFEDDLTPTASVSSDASDRQHRIGFGSGSDLKAMPEELLSEEKNVAGDNFTSEESGRTIKPFFNGSDSQFDDDAFSFRSELEDAATTLPQKNTSRKCGSGKSVKGDHQYIKKSESVNIFVRENDPFDDDDFFN